MEEKKFKVGVWYPIDTLPDEYKGAGVHKGHGIDVLVIDGPTEAYPNSFEYFVACHYYSQWKDGEPIHEYWDASLAQGDEPTPTHWSPIPPPPTDIFKIRDEKTK